MRVRPMTAAEFEPYLARLAVEFGGEQVRAGSWPAAGAAERAAAEMAVDLPQGVDTPEHVFLVAEDDAGPVGWVWVGLVHPRGTPDTAWLNDIEVAEDRRGRGFGHALLAAAEDAARAHGRHALALNVFGWNEVARGLYASAGYRVVSQQLSRDLSGD